MEEAIRAYLNVADAFLHRGDYSLAAGWNARGLQLASEHAPSYVTNAQLTDLQLDWLTGAWEGLEQRLLKAIDALEDWHSARNLVEALLGLLRLAQGDLRFASDVLRPFLNRYEVDIRMLSWVAAGSARIELADQRADAAVDAIAGVLSAIRESGGWIWAADLLQVAVEALIADERQDEARDVIDQLAAGLPGREAPAANAALATCRGLLAEAEGKPQRAALAFERADEAWQALPRPYEAARARSRAGQCLLSSDETQAYRLLSDALQTFEQLGAGWYAEHVRHVLRLHGLLPTHRRGRRSYGVQLSPREAQVAKLAAEGLSNREIARTLFVSVKTIEHHLSSASRKLGVRSRTELSSQLLERADAPLPPERSGRPRSQHVDSADSR